MFKEEHHATTIISQGFRSSRRHSCYRVPGFWPGCRAGPERQVVALARLDRRRSRHAQQRHADPAWAAANPNVEIEALAVPFDQLKNKFSTETATGGGPDLLIGPLDWVGELATGELIAPLDEMATADDPGAFLPATVDALKYDGKLYGMPESFETVALYYNTDLVQTAPATTAEVYDMSCQACRPAPTAWRSSRTSITRPVISSVSAASSSTREQVHPQLAGDGRVPELDQRLHRRSPGSSSRTTTPPSARCSRRARLPWSSTVRGRSATTQARSARTRSGSRRCR